MSALTKQILIFEGNHRDLSVAVVMAVDQANAWLLSHQWMDTDGRSVYTIVPFSAFDGTRHTYILHLIGPREETA